MYSIKCIIGRRADKPIFFKNSNAPDTSRIVLRTVWFVKFRRLNRRSGYSQMLDTICTKKGVRAAIMNNPVLSHVQPLLRISLSLSLSLTLCIIRKLLASTGTSFANKRRYASGEELFICTVEGPSPSCLCTMGVLNCSEYLQFLVCGHADRSVSRVTLGLDLRVSHSVLRASSGYG